MIAELARTMNPDVLYAGYLFRKWFREARPTSLSHFAPDKTDKNRRPEETVIGAFAREAQVTNPSARVEWVSRALISQLMSGLLNPKETLKPKRLLAAKYHQYDVGKYERAATAFNERFSKYPTRQALIEHIRKNPKDSLDWHVIDLLIEHDPQLDQNGETRDLDMEYWANLAGRIRAQFPESLSKTSRIRKTEPDSPPSKPASGPIRRPTAEEIEEHGKKNPPRSIGQKKPPKKKPPKR